MLSFCFLFYVAFCKVPGCFLANGRVLFFRARLHCSQSVSFKVTCILGIPLTLFLVRKENLDEFRSLKPLFRYKHHRDLDSVGAVAPIDFEEGSFCTLNYHAKVPLSSVFGSVSENLHSHIRNPLGP